MLCFTDIMFAFSRLHMQTPMDIIAWTNAKNLLDGSLGTHVE